MCEREGVPCEKIEGLGGVQEGACELLVSALEAQLAVQQQATMAMVSCPQRPRIAVWPAHKDFGFIVPDGVAQHAAIRVRNIGDADLRITGVRLLPQGQQQFALASAIQGHTIAPLQEHTFSVRCAPVSEGYHQANIAIASNAVNVDSPVLVSLFVIAGLPGIVVKPAFFDFGDVLVGQSSAPIEFVISNPGLDVLNVLGAAFDGAGFEISTGELSGTIAPADFTALANIKFSVRARPIGVDESSGTLVIKSNAAKPVANVVKLAMRGVRPEIAVSESAWHFKELLLGEDAVRHIFVIKNIGTAPLTVTSISLSGHPGFAFADAQTPERALAPGDTWDLAISCKPADVGPRAASLVIDSDAQNVGPVKLTLDAVGIRPEIDIDCKELLFGDMLITAEKGQSRHFTVTNKGSAPLHVASIKLGETTHFTLGEGAGTPRTLAPAEAWLVDVSGQPTVLGLQQVKLLIDSDAQNEVSPLALVLKANGVAPDISVDMDNVNFGTLFYGTPKALVVTIKNTGTAPLHISAIALGESDHFVLTKVPVFGQPIEIGGTRAFTITSTPTLDGLLQTTATIHSDAHSETQLLLPLRVVGELPTVTLQPSPAAVLHNAVARNQAQLTAAGTPGGGTYTWAIQAPLTADFVGALDPGNVTQADVKGIAPGTTTVTVTYQVGIAPAASASVPFHVVHVQITQGAALTVVHPHGLPAANHAINAVGTPAGGTPQFQALVHHVGHAVNYHGVTNTLNATVRTNARGRATAQVHYTLAGQTAQATIDLNVTTLACSKVHWNPAGAGNVAPAAVVPCPHEANPQQPDAFVLSVPAIHPHHHGDACSHCTDSGQPVHHYIHSDTNSNAVVALRELRTEIHALRALLPAHWFPGTQMPLAARNYIASHPWLQDVSVWLYAPAGWQPPCQRCNGTGRYRPQCNNCGGTGAFGGRRGQCRGCAGTGYRDLACTGCVGGLRPAKLKGKMIGVLIARDAQGRIYRLRGVSGNFKGTPTGNPEYGAANGFWARQLVNPARIPSASRGWRMFVGIGPTFGKCAATHMLAQALDQQLELLSMAEMWIGAPDLVHARTDGQLQTSCPHCRQYFAHMLCDAGAMARVRPFGGAAQIRNRGMRVSIAEEPVVYMSPGALGVQLHGTVVPGPGILQWQIQNPNIATFRNAVVNQINATLDAATPGTTGVRLNFDQGGVTTSAQITLHVLSIVEPNPFALPLALPAGRTFNAATPVPGPGTLQWQISNPAVARFAGGVVPGNVSAVTLEPLLAGATQLTVRVLVNGIATGAAAAITINVA